ncbi:MAG: ABC-F family ATP-binding cassette domain-containing protein [Nostocoides sp.]
MSALDHPRTIFADPGGPLILEGISASFSDRRVLTDITVIVPSGRIGCVIGENGSGKSTLLRIAAGIHRPDAGSITVPGRVGLHHQQPPFPDHLTVAQVLEHAMAPVRQIVRDVEREGQAMADGEPGAAQRLEDAIEAAERHHAWELDHRVEAVTGGFGLGALPRDRPAATLSGGQLARLGLAWLVLRAPDTLLLDEPTNHLDDAGAKLLLQMLQSWSGPVLVASHDRALLDEVTTDLFDLDPRPTPFRHVAHDQVSPGSGFGVTRFTGSYTDYRIWRQAELHRWRRQYRDEQAELRRLRARVGTDHTVGHAGAAPRTEGRASRKFYADRNATVVARRVNDAAARLARLTEEQVRKPPATVQFTGFTRGSSSAPRGVVLAAAQVSIPGRLTPTTVSLSASDRLLVTGGNGSGKSTLLFVLAGDLAPQLGSVQRERRLAVGLLTQNPLPRGAGARVRAAYASAVGDRVAEQVPLTTFGLLAGRDLDRPVASLSVGQRRRLDLAIVLADPPDVLLLDEPTNHLSLTLVSEIEAALPDFPGAVVIASHDRWLRRNWSGRTLHLDPPDPC